MSSEILTQIQKLVKQYVAEEKQENWTPGEDWIQYSGPQFTEDEYLAAINAILDGWLVLGKQGRKFELDFAKFLGKSDGILTNSGSSANLLMMSALTSNDKYIKKRWNLSKGDKFITPVVCFPTTLNPIIQCGFEPVFVDVTLPSLNLDLDQVEEILKKDTNSEIKGIIFAHVLGNPPDMDRVQRIVEEYDLIFLEDCCDALGSSYKGQKLGSFGTLSSCSFYPAHHITMGEGGFVASNSSKMRQILASFRDWGRACYCASQMPGSVLCKTACGNRFGNWLPQAPEIIYDHRYVFDEIGYNIKPLEMQAAIGLQQIKKIDQFHLDRHNNFDRLTEIFKPYEKYFHLPEAIEGSDPSWFAFLLTVKENNLFLRNNFVSHLEKHKIQTRSYFSGNILYHPGYKQYADQYTNLKQTFPIAHKVTSSSFFLGTYSGITKEKLDYIEKVVRSFFK
jgi:CDP-4-dehydro-6-deoxyglucose reductase, E1